MHETNGGMDYTTTTANADGKTMVYVYFTRKIYTLKFHYYGKTNDYEHAVATGTNGYSYGGVDKVLQDGFGCNAKGRIEGAETNSYWENKWEKISNNVMNIPVPQTITIKGKYGADLREVWPVARTEESIITDKNENAKMISWATTAGKYRDEAIDPNSTHYYEATLMGLFATMNEEIIADPKHDEIIHPLVAYWDTLAVSTYRYTHCYEVPNLQINSSGIVEKTLYNDDNNAGSLKNILYLVPKDNPAFTKYDFSDLLSVNYDSSTNKVEYIEQGQGTEGTYYAVRGYETTDENGNPVIKYYAVGRQIVTVSTNNIKSQNPSARAHMKKVNDVGDHTTQYKDADGRIWDTENNVKQVGSPDNPYDLYFYYDRDRYTIHYKVAVNKSDTDKTELELGRIELPYGTRVTKDSYAFQLDYKDTNQAENEDGTPKYRWTYPDGDEVRVCPDRNENGTKEWRFKGWGLGPAGVNMQWEFNPNPAEPQAQATDDFPIGSDLLLYAIWENPMCTVTFHLNGGTAATYTTDEPITVAADEPITVEVPANTKFTEVENAKIPRPFRSGYTMAGWYISDENGNITNEEQEFAFDQYITDDIHVAAKWTEDTVTEYDYTVYHVTDNPKAVVANNTIYIKGNDEIVQDGSEGAKEYYVLETVEDSKSCVPGTTINLKPINVDGYISTETNKKLTFNNQGEEYYVIFYYDSYTKGSYTVRYVEAGTEGNTNPTVIQQTVIAKEEVNADKAVLTPSKTAVEILMNKGYQLVNRNVDGTYTKVEEEEGKEEPAYKKLKWLDSKGIFHEFSEDMTDLLDGDVEKTITYLVQPIQYTITYQNAADSPSGAAEALAAVTAVENTPVGSAKGKNPTLYTAKDTFTLNNPTLQVHANGRVYEFSHWTLGTDTSEKQITGLRDAGSEDGRYNSLTVDQGTVGNLTFVAHYAPKPTGSLTVSKTVTGDLGDKTKDFTFKVTLAESVSDGTYGDLTFTDGVATFTLKHGESKTATGLPAGVHYKVEESDNVGYTVTYTGETGTIKANETATAAFTNDKSSDYTSVKVKKVWKLDDGGKAADSVKVALLKNGVVDKTVTLNEANNWTHTWTGLALGNIWTVQELDVPEGFDSIISSIGTNFTITNDDKPGTPDDPNKPVEPDDPDNPDNPDKPDKPDKPDDPNNPDKPAKPDKPDTPNPSDNPGEKPFVKTGDDNSLSLYVLLFASTLAALTIAGTRIKRKKEE